MKSFKIRMDLFNEFMRYVLVGGLASVVDIGVLYVLVEFIFPTEKYALYIATGLGFITGLLVNYILSINYVFTGAKESKLGKSLRDIIIFSLIGVIGLGLTELGMFIGTEGIKMNYLIVKIMVTLIVLFWNYTARKILVFRKAKATLDNITRI